MQPQVAVGIISAKEVSFTLAGIYSTPDVTVVTGRHTVRVSDSGIALVWEGRTYTSISFTPSSKESDSFTLESVTIGLDFHWQRKENQQFRGELSFIVADGKVVVVNRVDVEEYLASVISSEMSSSSPLQMLRAHAVISRSWLLAQMEHRSGNSQRAAMKTEANGVGASRIVRWWDHEDHDLFDVCADDHCQRYQGLTRVNEAAAAAVNDTRGLVLTTDGHKLCDARFSKCCGGMMEVFSSCWADEDYPYLQGRRDNLISESTPNLTDEHNAGQWIHSRPEAFCSEVSEDILSKVLNGYDRELGSDYYRWKVTLSQEEICRLLKDRAGIDVGKVIDLIATRRGTSGRIVMLRIVGSDGTVEIGKELMIRRALSPSHLLSSAFTVERHFDTETSQREVPAGFTLHGAGWGHGVGLCQIGAAVMAERGYDYRSILAHYYPTSRLTQAY